MISNIRLIAEEDDRLVYAGTVTGKVGDVEPHDEGFIIPHGMIANRVAFYGLDSEDAALTAIFREFDYGLQGKSQPRPFLMGGLRLVRRWSHLSPAERSRYTGGLETAETQVDQVGLPERTRRLLGIARRLQNTPTEAS